MSGSELIRPEIPLQSRREAQVSCVQAALPSTTANNARSAQGDMIRRAICLVIPAHGSRVLVFGHFPRGTLGVSRSYERVKKSVKAHSNPRIADLKFEISKGNGIEPVCFCDSILIH